MDYSQMDHDGMLDNNGSSVCLDMILGGTLVTEPTSSKQVVSKWRRLPRSLKRDEILVEIDNEKRKADVNVDLRLDILGGRKMSKKKKGEREVCGEVTVTNKTELEFLSSFILRSVTTERYADRVQ